MSTSSAARTNLTSSDVRISNRNIGEGTFRVCLGGTYIGGNRNGQEAACKRFKPRFRSMEMEFFATLVTFRLQTVRFIMLRNGMILLKQMKKFWLQKVT